MESLLLANHFASRLRRQHEYSPIHRYPYCAGEFVCGADRSSHGDHQLLVDPVSAKRETSQSADLHSAAATNASALEEPNVYRYGS